MCRRLCPRLSDALGRRLADSPGVRIRLRETGDVECPDNDLRDAGGHVGPHHLFDVVCTIETGRGPHVAVTLRAVGGDYDEIEIVLESVAGRVGPGECDFECRT